eukprot:1783895-Prymnesium_polylepis.1
MDDPVLLSSDLPYDLKVQLRHRLSDTYADRNRSDGGRKNDFDVFDVEWTCPDREMVPYAYRWGDGHKWMCGMSRPRPVGCLLYSFGSNGEDSWERAVALRRLECEIHIFDHTLTANETRRMEARSRAYGARFHPVGLGARDTMRTPHRDDESAIGGVRGLSDRGGQVLRLGTIMRLLGHEWRRRIDFLKVDVEGACEGAEWKAFLGHEGGATKEGIFHDCAMGRLQIDQLLIELHGMGPSFAAAGGRRALDAWFRGADACHLRTFSKESNVWAPCPAYWACGTKLFEYSLVAPSSL